MFRYILLILLSTAILLGTELKSFKLTHVNGIVKIEFQTGNENKLTDIIIEKSSNDINYREFKTQTPEGSNSRYLVLDKDPYLKFNGNNIYYRIKFINSDGSFNYSDSKSVEIATAGIHATWGSLKAMFR